MKNPVVGFDNHKYKFTINGYSLNAEELWMRSDDELVTAISLGSATEIDADFIQALRDIATAGTMNISDEISRGMK